MHALLNHVGLVCSDVRRLLEVSCDDGMPTLPRRRRLQRARTIPHRSTHARSSVPVRRSVSAYTLQRFCQGGRDLPQAKKDFWTPLNQTQLQSIVDNDDSLLAGRSLFFYCGSGRCGGGKNSSCEDGYTGALCNRCVRGRFSWMGACDIKCEDLEPAAAYGVVSVLGIMACVVAWLLMNKMTAGRCCDIAVTVSTSFLTHSILAVGFVSLKTSP